MQNLHIISPESDPETIIHPSNHIIILCLCKTRNKPTKKKKKRPLLKFKLIREFAKTPVKDFVGLRHFLHSGSILIRVQSFTIITHSPYATEDVFLIFQETRPRREVFMWKGIKHLLLLSSTLHLNVEPTQSHTRPRIIMVKHSRVTLSTFGVQKR